MMTDSLHSRNSNPRNRVKGFASRGSKFAIRSRRACSPNLFEQLLQILKHFVFFVRAREARLIEIHSFPSSLAVSRRGFAFCLADPIGSAVARLSAKVIGRLDRVKCFASRGLVVLS
jgi:hypothetical protein